MPIVSRVKRPSVTITSPGSPGLPRRNTSPTALGEIQVKHHSYIFTKFLKKFPFLAFPLSTI